MPTTHRLPLFGFLGAVVLLLALGLVTHYEVGEQEEAARLVEHTHLVIEALQRVPSGLGAAESSLRGFQLQGDERFLVDFEPAVRETEDGLADARELTRENQARQAELAALAPKLEQRFALLHERIQAYRTTGDHAIHPAARPLTHEIRASIAAMVADELRLLDARSRVRETRLRQLRFLSPLGLLASTVLVGLAFIVLSREVKQRQEAVRAAAEHGKRLGDLLDESAVMLELGELLSACRTVNEANRVVADFGPRLFAGSSGAVCILAESQNLLEPVARWGSSPSKPGTTTFAPDDCWALRRGRPHHTDSSMPGAACTHVTAEVPTLCIPLSANGQVIGILQCTESAELRESIERRAVVIGDQLAMALANLRLRETLRNQSIRDVLTGLFNRRYTDETLARELHRATREEGEVSVIAIDVDHFKKFNDVHGHQAGDKVLSQLGAMLRKHTRGSDVASRMGGEELAVLMPGAQREHAAARAEEIRRAAEELAVVHDGRNIGPVTLSIGVASFPADGSNADDVMRAADAALYRAKREGRNRVVLTPRGSVAADSPGLPARPPAGSA